MMGGRNRYTRRVIALPTTVAMGALVFAATNVDDILLLALFFADRTLRPAAVIAGQFVGIGVLTAVSGAVALLALAIPSGWLALLGVIPLGLGLRGLHELWRSRSATELDADDLDMRGKSMKRGIHSQWISVALVTVANGGDNLGVYIPLFSRNFSQLALYVAIFAVMTALWCMAGYWLVKHPRLGVALRRYGHIALPVVLIALGLLILNDARVLLP